MANATIHVDGALALRSLELSASDLREPTIDAYLFFKIRAGIQEHPVWALGRLAVVVLCYAHVAKMQTGDLSGVLQTTLEGTLISNTVHTNILARRIYWHTSSAIRSVSERLIGDIMTGQVGPDALGSISLLQKTIPHEIAAAAEANERRKALSSGRGGGRA